MSTNNERISLCFRATSTGPAHCYRKAKAIGLFKEISKGQGQGHGRDGSNILLFLFNISWFLFIIFVFICRRYNWNINWNIKYHHIHLIMILLLSWDFSFLIFSYLVTALGEQDPRSVLCQTAKSEDPSLCVAASPNYLSIQEKIVLCFSSHSSRYMEPINCLRIIDQASSSFSQAPK